MKYYVRSGSKTYGPVDENKIRIKIKSGFFSPDCTISADRQVWMPLPPDQQDSSMSSAPPMPETSADNAGGRGYAPPPPPRIRLVPPVADPENAPDGERGGTMPQITPFAMDGHTSGAGGDDSNINWRPALIAASLLISLGIVIAGAWIGYKKYYTEKDSSPITSRGNRKTPAGKPRKKNFPQTKNFEEVCANYHSAVGVVVVTLENADGELLTRIGDMEVDPVQPVGTAFAVDEEKFVTNCHVAYALKDQKKGVLAEILFRYYVREAKKRGVSSKEQFLEFLKANEAMIAKDRAFLEKYARVRKVEIRLSHSGGMTLPVVGVQIHPKYQAKPKDQYVNAEFDVAILTTGKPASVYFKIADKKVLYQLAQGQKIAYLGFPMEGLLNSGGLNVDKPEATFKSGTINKITNFNNEHGTPENNKSITHDIPTVGGASGSPIFLENGEIVAVLWGGNHDFSGNGRKASAALHNFAVRIDSLDLVGEEKMHDINTWLGENKK